MELLITVFIGGLALGIISLVGIAIQRKLGGGRRRTAKEEQMFAESHMYTDHHNHLFD